MAKYEATGGRPGVLSRLLFGSVFPALLSTPSLFASLSIVGKCKHGWQTAWSDFGDGIVWIVILGGSFCFIGSLVVNGIALLFMSSVRTKGRAFLFGFAVVLAMCCAVAATEYTTL